jgi:hypothetical protein
MGVQSGNAPEPVLSEAEGAVRPPAAGWGCPPDTILTPFLATKGARSDDVPTCLDIIETLDKSEGMVVRLRRTHQPARQRGLREPWQPMALEHLGGIEAKKLAKG